MEQQSIDNGLAASIGERIVELPLVANMLPVDTNIIVFDIVPDTPTAAEIVDRLKERDVLLGAFGERRLRVVTCLNVDEEAANRHVAELTTVLSD